MIREVTRFLTCDGKIYESEQQARNHATTVLENRIGDLFDMLTNGCNISASASLKMLENAMQNKDVLCNHFEAITKTIHWE